MTVPVHDALRVGRRQRARVTAASLGVLSPQRCMPVLVSAWAGTITVADAGTDGLTDAD